MKDALAPWKEWEESNEFRKLAPEERTRFAAWAFDSKMSESQEYARLSPEEQQAFRKTYLGPYAEVSEPQPEEPAEDGLRWYDPAVSLARGAVNLAGSTMAALSLDPRHRPVFKMLGVEPYKEISKYTGKAEEALQKMHSPAWQAEQQKEFVETTEPGEGWFGTSYKPGEGVKSATKIADLLLTSAPASAAGMGAGGVVTKGLLTAAKTQGIKWLTPQIAGVIGGAIGEGGTASLMASNQMYRHMQGLDDKSIAASPYFQKRFGEDATPENIAKAKDEMAALGAAAVGLVVAPATGLLGAPSGHFIGKLLGGEGGKSLFGSVLKSAGLEGLQEAMQEPTEKLFENVAVKVLEDRDQALSEGLGEAVVGGLISGAAMGGPMGGIAHRYGEDVQPPVPQDVPLKALPAPPPDSGIPPIPGVSPENAEKWAQAAQVVDRAAGVEPAPGQPHAVGPDVGRPVSGIEAEMLALEQKIANQQEVLANPANQGTDLAARVEKNLQLNLHQYQELQAQATAQAQQEEIPHAEEAGAKAGKAGAAERPQGGAEGPLRLRDDAQAGLEARAGKEEIGLIEDQPPVRVQPEVQPSRVIEAPPIPYMGPDQPAEPPETASASAEDEKSPTDRTPETIAESLAAAGEANEARRKAFTELENRLPEGTKLGKWEKTTIGGDVFWTDGKKTIPNAYEAVGPKKVVEALGLPEDAAFNPEGYLSPGIPEGEKESALSPEPAGEAKEQPKSWFGLGEMVARKYEELDSSGKTTILKPSIRVLHAAAKDLGISAVDAHRAISVYNAENPRQEEKRYAEKPIPAIASKQAARQKANQPWEMTRKQFAESVSEGGVLDERAFKRHRNIVQLALNEGKPVPEDVLKDYPDLAANKPSKEPPEPATEKAAMEAAVDEFFAGDKTAKSLAPEARAKLEEQLFMIEQELAAPKTEDPGFQDEIRKRAEEIRSVLGAQAASESTTAAPAGPEAQGIPFVDYEGAKDWIEKKSAEYQDRNKFLASREYKDAYPVIRRLFETEQANWSQKAKQAMSESSVSYGDKVQYGSPGPFMTPISLEGTIVERKGVPWVQLDPVSAQQVNRSRVRWHKGWTKAQGAAQGAPESTAETKPAQHEAPPAFSQRELGILRNRVKYAQSLGLDLADAKAAVQAYESGDPEAVKTRPRLKDAIAEANKAISEFIRWQKTGQEPAPKFQIGDVVRPKIETGINETAAGAIQHIWTDADGTQHIKTKKTGNLHFMASDFELVSRAEPEAQGKADIGTAHKIKIPALATIFHEQLKSGGIKEGATKVDIKKFVADRLGVKASDLSKEKGYSHKPVEEAFEYAIVKRAREIVDEGGTEEQVYAKLKAVYDSQPNLATRTSTSMINQAYSTPVHLAYLAQRFAGVTKSTWNYEPTAGTGMLLTAGEPATTIANELNPDRLEVLKDQNFLTSNDDATTKANTNIEADAVVANPPFGAIPVERIDGYKISKLEHKIVMKALETMKDTGKAAFIIGGGHFNQEGKMLGSQRTFLNWLYNHYNVVANVEIPGSEYSRQGASFPVRLIAVHGRKKTPEGVAPFDNDVYLKVKTVDEILPILKEVESGKTSVVPERAGDRPHLPEGDRGPAAGGADRPADRGEVQGPVREQDTETDRGGPGPDEHAGDVPGDSGVVLVEGEREPGGGVSAHEGRRPLEPSSVEGHPSLEGGLHDRGSEALDRPPRKGPREPKGIPARTGGVDTGRVPGPGDNSVDAAINELLNLSEQIYQQKAKEEGLSVEPTEEKPAPQPAETPQETAAPEAPKKTGLDLIKEGVKEFNAIFGEEGSIGIGEKIPDDDPRWIQAKTALDKIWEGLKLVYGDAKERAKVFIEQIYSQLGAKGRPYIDKFIQTTIRADIEAQAAKPSEPKIDVQETDYQVEYRPKSKGAIIDATLIPKKMQESVNDSLDRLEAEVGDIDEYVSGKLGYKGVDALHRVLSADQVDAVALAIYQIDRGSGMIIGDQTGVGKGRVAAAVYRYANRLGALPAFFTAKPELFTDFYRDMMDIGHERFNPFIVASDPKRAAIADQNGRIVFPLLPSDRRIAGYREIARHGSGTGVLNNYDGILSNYSQVNAETNIQQRVFSRLFPGNVVILDEAHKASGLESNIGLFMRDALQNVRGVTYLSATFAKRPDTMPLYYKTDLSRANLSLDELISAVANGGPPLQEIVSAGLAKLGQMIRREKSFAGISMDAFVDSKNRARDEARSDAMTEGMRTIFQFDSDFAVAFSAELTKAKKRAKKTGEIEVFGLVIPAGQAEASGRLTTSVTRTNFAATAHNAIRQLLFAMKADLAVEKAVQDLQERSKAVRQEDGTYSVINQDGRIVSSGLTKEQADMSAAPNGRKVMITCDHTMESFVDYLITDVHELEIGGQFNIGYSAILKRNLQRCLAVKVKDAHGDPQTLFVDVQNLPKYLRDSYYRAEDFIDEMTGDIPGSPIDHIKAGLTKAGYRVGEITGRQYAADFTDPDNWVLAQRASKETVDKKEILRDFNNGEIDVILVNRSAAEGVSAHASPKFKDQRPRSFLGVQPQLNVDDEVQLMGRINRKGQVALPKYKTLYLDIPAEIRPASVLMRKMKSLSANTSANSDSPLAQKTLPDMMNKYGDQVTRRWLQNHRDLAASMGLDPEKDDFTKASGRMAMQPVSVQREFFEEIESEYTALIQGLKEMGLYDLEVQDLDFKAQTIEKDVITAGTDESHPFASSTFLEKVSMINPSKPFTRQQLSDFIEERRRKRNLPEQNPDEIRSKVEEYIQEKSALAARADRAYDEQPVWMALNETLGALRAYTVGDTYHVEMPGLPPMTGVIIDIKRDTKSAGNPAALSKTRLEVAVNNALRKVTISLASISRNESRLSFLEDGIVDNWDEIAPAEVRSERFLITGNLLQGFADAPEHSRIVRYTTEDGKWHEGILLPANYDAAGKADRVRLTPDLAASVLQSGNPLVGDVVEIRSDRTITMPASRQRGGPFFLDERLRSLVEGGEFESVSDQMRARIKPGSEREAINRAYELGETFLVDRSVYNAVAGSYGQGSGGTGRGIAEAAHGMRTSLPNASGGRDVLLQRVRTVKTSEVRGPHNKVLELSAAASLLAGLRKQANEHLYVVTTDKDGNVLEVHRAYKGTKSGAKVSPSEIAGRVINTKGAKKAYIFHNHPSGDPDPSPEDLAFHAHVAGLLRLKGIESRSGVISGTKWAGYGEYGKHSPSSQPIRPIRRTTPIPVKERVLIKSIDPESVYAISGPEDATRVIRDVFNDQEGLLVLNRKNKPLGFIPYEIGTPTKTHAADIVGQLEKVNASAVLFNSAQPVQGTKRGEFIRNLAAALEGDITVLDVIEQGKAMSSDARDAFINMTRGGRQATEALDALRVSDVLLSVAPESSQTASPGSKALSRVAIQFIVRDLKKRWKNPAEIHVVEDMDEISEEGVRQAITPGMRVRGVFVDRGGTRKIYLIASNLRSAVDVKTVLLHEALGHDGLRQAFPAGKINALLDDIWKQHAGEIREVADYYSLDTARLRDRRIAADEWMAFKISTDSLPQRIWDRIVAAVRSWARKLFPNLDLSVAEIKVMARDAILQGPSLAGAAGYRFLQVFHGTPHVWHPEPGFPHGRPRLDFSGTGEGGAAYGRGFYVTDSRNLAEEYRERLTNRNKGVAPKSGYVLIGDSLIDLSTADVENLNDWAVLDDLFKISVHIENGWAKSYDTYMYLQRLADHIIYKYRGSSEFSMSVLDAIRSSKITTENANEHILFDLKPTSSLYKLEIPDDVIPKLLDWDKPLSEQTEYVKNALAPARTNKFDLAPKDKTDIETGATAYARISDALGSDKAASEYLASIGIPGNTHGGISKGATGKKYVIWDQDVLDRIALLERNAEKLDAIREAESIDSRYSFSENDRALWTEERLDREIQLAEYPDGNTKGMVAWVRPEEFLKATTPTDTYADAVRSESGSLNAAALAKDPQSMFLQVEEGPDGFKIMGHEGRHRMAALAAAGVRKVPVVLDFPQAKNRGPERLVRIEAQHGGRLPIVVRDAMPLNRDNRDAVLQQFVSGEGADIRFSQEPPAKRQEEISAFKEARGRARSMDPGKGSAVPGEQDLTGYSEYMGEDGSVRADNIRIDPLTEAILGAQQEFQGESPDTASLPGNPALRLFESVTDRLRRSGSPTLVDLADRITRYYDRFESRIGWWNGALRPHLKEVSWRERKKFLRDFEVYIRHHDNRREDEAEEVLAQAHPELRKLIKTMDRLFHEAGLENIEQGVMVADGALVLQNNVSIGRVRKDAAGQEIVVDFKDGRRINRGYLEDLKREPGNIRVGGWRLIGKIQEGKFWPRSLKPDVQRVLSDTKYRNGKGADLWAEMVDALIVDGFISSPDQALAFVTNYFSKEAANDYFANIEKARGEKLPEMFYDYSFNVLNRYAYKWSQRISQIEFFGQERGEHHPDIFGRLLQSGIDRDTKKYIDQIRTVAYSIKTNSNFEAGLDLLNVIATAIQLGNPATALVNYVGGTTLNLQMLGWKNVAKAHLSFLTDWQKIQQEGVELGILGKDILNILRDTDAGTSDLFDAQSNLKQNLSAFAAWTMKWGGYRDTENFIRATGMVAARYQLQDALRVWNRKPDSHDARMYRNLMARNGIDVAKLIMENGAGDETAKYLRKMVNIPQGSYRIDQTPLYVDTRVGRFFFKYQKFSTQVSKMLYDNFLKPFAEAKTGADRVRALGPLIGYFAKAFIGGSLILTARAALFGLAFPGPDDDDLVNALKGDDNHRRLTFLFSRAFNAIMAASALGFYGNYIQFAKDVNDRHRVKNPLEPPGLASIDAAKEIVLRFYEQEGKLTARDIDEVTTAAFAFYRSYKRLGTGALAALGSEWREAQLEKSRRESNYARKTVRLWAEESGIEAKRTATGRFARTPDSPIKTELKEALRVGNREAARLLVQKELKGLVGTERARKRQALQSSALRAQPVAISGSMNNSERIAFYKWAAVALSPANYARIRNLDVNYRRDIVYARLLEIPGYIPPEDPAKLR